MPYIRVSTFQVAKTQQEQMTIILVEDQKIVALDIRYQLEALNHRVIALLSSGEECMAFLKKEKADLILMDIQLKGGMSGLDAAKVIHANYEIPILFLTDYLDDSVLNEIKQAGYYGYINKPFKQIDLHTEILFTVERYRHFIQAKKKQSEIQLEWKETEEFYRQIVNNVSDIIYRIDLKGYFTYVNPSAIRQTGFTEEELLSMPFTSLIHPDAQERAFSFFKEVYESKHDFSTAEFPMLRKDGNVVWIGQEVHLLTSNNQITGFQVIARDITLEKEFKEQLIIAKTNAEKTAELKSRFLANMSHEIRTPLNGIIGIINLLENTTLSHKQQVYIQAILSSSNQLMGIINDVLDLSKIDAGKLVMESTAFDLYGLVDSVQTVFEVTTKEKGIQLICTVAQDIPQFVIGDPVRLNQILYNIIGNAVKFTDQGRVEVMLTLVHLEEESCTILFQIRDTGVGMDEQVINKIFDSFTQAESDTTRKFGGTGLGLAIVKNLVKLLGGSIEVKSKQAIGSTFIIELPFLIAHESLVEVKTDKKIDESIQLKGLSILVVEDNPINQLVTRDLLEEKEVRVAVASNGQIALDLMRETAFDLVLMDMQMPVLDGYQTMRLIRKMENGSPKHMPIIALTANAIESETQKCFEAGADAYVAKPFRPDYLFDEIQSLLHASDKKNMKNDTISIDMGTFSMFLNNNRPLMVKTLEQLITAFHDEESVLQNKALANDPIELRKVVHRMKPNFGIVGLTEWESFCKEIEGNEALTPAQSEVVIHRILGVIPSLVEAISNEQTKMKQVIQEKQVP